MRFVHYSGKAMELNYMWLPTWLGQNTAFKKELEAALGPELVGRDMDDDSLDWAHGRVIEIICERFPLEGLKDYLDGLKFVNG